ncbi:A/G-specific adenine glycosylase [Ramlibacter sp. AN1015]|uniref:A/G-specific adenine glycosylase n=1 Tax=Ramlibacter sp. AN1015 TaxID=3133428 RepID=UPI0030C35887
MRASLAGFAGRVVEWQARHGRSGLPWQATRDPYRVWLSEVMLQQTQVSTVLGYYERFLQRFPRVEDLAAAPLDDVLALWSGLGYYSRARNLHACAQQVAREHGGVFPRSALALQALPGIGRSTAAAIAAFCFGERVAILDANVKRVLTRVLAFDEDIAVAAHERRLWEAAQQMLPGRGDDMPGYTQGLMDLGATVCSVRRPECPQCPAQALCAAHAAATQEHYPKRTRVVRRRAESLWLLHARRADGAVWLHRRPDRGVWAGLYCLPAFASFDDLRQAVTGDTAALEEGAAFVHALTHKELHLHPVSLRVAADAQATPAGAGQWWEADRWTSLGLPAPVRRFLLAAP